MTQKAQRLLQKIGNTLDASLHLTRANSEAAQELKDLGFAEFIPISTGGADIALTQAGIDEYEKVV